MGIFRISAEADDSLTARSAGLELSCTRSYRVWRSRLGKDCGCQPSGSPSFNGALAKVATMSCRGGPAEAPAARSSNKASGRQIRRRGLPRRIAGKAWHEWARFSAPHPVVMPLGLIEGLAAPSREVSLSVGGSRLHWPRWRISPGMRTAVLQRSEGPLSRYIC